MILYKYTIIVNACDNKVHNFNKKNKKNVKLTLIIK